MQAIHPGYGFLNESPEFARVCEEAGIVFVGPSSANLDTFSDKSSARETAVAAGVPVVPGSDSLASAAEAESFLDQIGLPIILKAAMGGGRKGMRVVRE